MTIPFLYQLQKADFASLSATDFRIGVVDMDETGLTAVQVADLSGGQDKIMLTYLSIGEAEDYRGYWSEGNWSSTPPNFLLSENPSWPGNYSVKFWDPVWQDIMFARVDEAIALGYNGMYLDIVDAYEVAQVTQAYSGTNDQLRQEMIDFVVALSEHAKSLNPNFLVVPQNAVGLLALDESDPDTPNTTYLAAIDGLGVEDLWYNGNKVSNWTGGDLAFIQNALDSDKFVLATSYPADDTKQATFINNAINAGLIPFVANRNLTGAIDSANDAITAAMVGHDIRVPWGSNGDDGLFGGPGDDRFLLSYGDDVATGGTGADKFIIDGRYINDGDGHRITDLNFGEGDILVFRQFDPGSFDNSLDQINHMDVSNSGGDATFNTSADIVEAHMNGVLEATGAKDGDTLLTISASGQQVSVELDGLSFASLGLGGSGGGGGGSQPAPSGPQNIIGSQFDDVMLGSSGDDEFLLRYGKDTVTGGSGADFFKIDGRYANDGDSHTIRDLDFSEGDVIAFRYMDAGTFDNSVDPSNYLYVWNNGTKARFDSVEDILEAHAYGVMNGVLEATGAKDGDTLLTISASGQQVSVELDGLSFASLGLGGSGGGGGGSQPAPSGPQNIIGSQFDDVMLGSSGDDEFLLRYGKDTVTGGSGADFFKIDGRYANEGDSHTIRDLDFSEGDVIAFRYMDAGTFDNSVDPSNYLYVWNNGTKARFDSVEDILEAHANGVMTAADDGFGGTILSLAVGGMHVSLTLEGWDIV